MISITQGKFRVEIDYEPDVGDANLPWSIYVGLAKKDIDDDKMLGWYPTADTVLDALPNEIPCGLYDRLRKAVWKLHDEIEAKVSS